MALASTRFVVAFVGGGWVGMKGRGSAARRSWPRPAAGVSASSSEVGSWPSAASSSATAHLGPDQVDCWGAADDLQLPPAAERCGLLGQGVGGSGHVGSFPGRGSLGEASAD